MSMVFPGFKDGARFRPGFDKSKGAERLHQLMEKHGHLDTDMVIKEARRASSALHEAFIWDAEEALEHSHRVTAQKLLTNFVVVTVADDESRQTEKAIVPVWLKEDDEARVYIRLDEAMSDIDTRQQVLAQAKNELYAFRRKYARLQELAGVFAAISALESTATAAA